MRMVRPPYSKVYCAWAAVLANKRNVAVANSFLISHLLNGWSRTDAYAPVRLQKVIQITVTV
jgi:hypothetical protein